MARRFAADMRHSETGRLVAVASRNHENAKNFESGVEGFASYEALAAADTVDAIYIATPNALHKDHCLLAIRGGKAVLCEKPFATDAAEAKEIAVEAETASVFCMEGMWTSFLPGVVAARNAIAEGAIGTLLGGQASLGFARLETAGDPITDPGLGGGALLDIGVYCASLLDDFLGPAQIVTSDCKRSTSGAVRHCTAMLAHKGGEGDRRHSNFVTSHDANLPNRLEIFGTSGRIEIGAPFLQAQRTKLWRFEQEPYQSQQPASALKNRVSGLSIWPTVRNLAKSVIGEGGETLNSAYVGTGLQFQIDEVGRCVKLNLLQGDSASLDKTIRVLALLDELAKH